MPRPRRAVLRRSPVQAEHRQPREELSRCAQRNRVRRRSPGSRTGRPQGQRSNATEGHHDHRGSAVSRCVHHWRLTEPDGRMPTGRAFAAAPAAASAMCSSATPPTRQPSGGASARSGSGASDGPSECGAAATAARSRGSPDALDVRPFGAVFGTSATWRQGAGVVGHGSGLARQSWRGTATAVWSAVPPA